MFAEARFRRSCRLVIGWAAPWALVAGVALWDGAGAQAQGCDVAVVGPDTTAADGGMSCWLGRGLIQAFLVSEPWLRSITLWGGTGPFQYQPALRIFITEADANGYPDATSLIYASPTLLHPVGDGIHATPIPLKFEPPFELPRTGYFGLAIVAPDCGIVWFQAGYSNPYPEGGLWDTAANSCGDVPFHTRNFKGSADLLFRVETCANSTPAAASSWGGVKARYR